MTYRDRKKEKHKRKGTERENGQEERKGEGWSRKRRKPDVVI